MSKNILHDNRFCKGQAKLITKKICFYGIRRSKNTRDDFFGGEEKDQQNVDPLFVTTFKLLQDDVLVIFIIEKT